MDHQVVLGEMVRENYRSLTLCLLDTFGFTKADQSITQYTLVHFNKTMGACPEFRQTKFTFLKTKLATGLVYNKAVDPYKFY